MVAAYTSPNDLDNTIPKITLKKRGAESGWASTDVLPLAAVRSNAGLAPRSAALEGTCCRGLGLAGS